ncbi:competence protein ComFC [Bacillus pakistanensis]|uniref:Competence protein ComFC n=1 Tax=Rossellomorea pakistanensis TaxID=992288 RepID=A0ABS2NDA0_9BACI|nr:ComF family protein [Bacillus pakistanensis]MBM7585789.1 competence protein ComFC [Bacillus pakistanensis]
MNETCLYCQQKLRFDVTWSTLLLKFQEQWLCEKCASQLVKIEGKSCTHCSRNLEKLDSSLVDEDICFDCHRWENNGEWRGVLTRNTSIYEYNDFLKEYLARFKYRGDYVLARAFSQQIHELVKTFQYDLAVPIPLSKERQYERGFNQADAILIEAGLKSNHLLTRLHSEKQSKKSRSERIQNQHVFQTTNSSSLKNQSILLIDDIYTTGSTLRQAAKTLKQAGAKEVNSLTIAR